MAINGKTAGMLSGLGIGLASGVILAALNPILPRTDETRVAHAAPSGLQEQVASVQDVPAPTVDENVPASRGAPELSVTAGANETAPTAPIRPDPSDGTTVATRVGELQTDETGPTGLALVLPQDETTVPSSGPLLNAPDVAGRDSGPTLDTTPAAPLDVAEPSAATDAPSGLAGQERQDPALTFDLPEASQPGQVETAMVPEMPQEDQPADVAIAASPGISAPRNAPQTQVAQSAGTESAADTTPPKPAVEEEQTKLASLPEPEPTSPVSTEIRLPRISAPDVGASDGAQADVSQDKIQSSEDVDSTPTISLGNAQPRTVGTLATLGTSGSSRFPQIGNSDSAGTTNEGSIASRLPKIEPQTDTFASAQTETINPQAGALQRNSLPFGGADRPLLSLVVLDTGDLTDRIDALKALGLPFAIAVPADRANATKHARRFRNAGFEVLALAPRDVRISLSGNQSEDQVAATLGAIFNTMPDAVGLIDRPAATIQKDQRLTRYVVNSFADSGHGLVTYGGGLNASERIAAQRNVPAGQVFRVLDAQDETNSIGLSLNRAAMEARSKGQVIVMTMPDAETLTALSDWFGSARARAVSVAPVSATLTNGMLR